MDGSERMHIPFALLFVSWCGLASAATFFKGDQVELLKPTPLVKEGQVVRNATAGEKFTVMISDPQKHLIVVDTQDASGKDCIVTLSDALVRPVQGAGGSIFGGKPTGLAARLDAKAREQSMEAGGGKKESEEAVVRGLRWLVHTQNADGSWGDSQIMNPGVTGLAVLSLLGHGETPASPEFGPGLQKAIDWMMANGQKHDGRLGAFSGFSGRDVEMHAIATTALAEYYRVTKDARVVELLKKAIGYMLEGQGGDGGWDYGFAKASCETPITVWHIEALDTVRQSGLTLAGVDIALGRAAGSLRNMQSRDGGFGIRSSSADYDATAMAIFGLYLCTHKRDETTRQGIEYLMKHTAGTYAGTTKGSNIAAIHYQDEHADLYTWYFNTRACFASSTTAWNSWNRLFQNEVVKNQSPDGSWPAHKGGVDFFGGHSLLDAGPRLESVGTKTGAVYRTSLCVLMLETYYRDMVNVN